MATFGQGINPQLGAINYSPILQGSVAGAQMAAKGGQMIGQGLANLGQEVGQGIQKYAEQKKKNAERDGRVDAALGAIQANAKIMDRYGQKDAAASLRLAGYNLIQEPNLDKRAAMADTAVSSFLQGQQIEAGAKQKQIGEQAAELLMRYGQSGGASSYMGTNGETFGSPEANLMAQNQYLAQTTTRLQQDKLLAEAQALRTPKPENLTVPEMAIRAEITAEKKRLKRDLTPEEEANKIKDVQLRTSPSPVSPEETARYTLLTGEMKDIGAKADAALRLRPTLKSLYDKLEKGLQTGELEDFKTTISGYAKAVGIPVDEKMLADKQSARASFGTFLMEYIAATKGSISERENTLFMSMGPQFANIPEANKELLALVISRQDLDMQLGNIYRNGLSNNKISIAKINEDMQAYRQEFEKKYEINIGKLEEKYVPQKPSSMEQKVWDAMPMADKAMFKK